MGPDVDLGTKVSQLILWFTNQNQFKNAKIICIFNICHRYGRETLNKTHKFTSKSLTNSAQQCPHTFEEMLIIHHN